MEGGEAVALTAEEIEALLEGHDLPEGESQYKFFRPTSIAVERWVEYAKGSDDCFFLGLGDIDQKMRGVWPSDVLVVTRTAASQPWSSQQWHATY